jgi:hypothetical protein
MPGLAGVWCFVAGQVLVDRRAQEELVEVMDKQITAHATLPPKTPRFA